MLRQFEKRAYDLFMQNLVKGTCHLSLGMEAIAAGFGLAMRPDDYTFATYRGHAHTIARGAALGPVMAELLGRENGILGGKGGSMHLTSVEHGMMGSYAIIGAHLCVANGAAWSAQMRGTDQVAVAFFGDGTTNIGAFHEALNLAVVWNLPVVFVCENNLYMEYTPIDLVTSVRNPGRGPGRGLRTRSRSWSTATTPTPSMTMAAHGGRKGPAGERARRCSRRSPTGTAATPGPTPASIARPARSKPGWATTRSRCTTSGCCAWGCPRAG